MFCTILFFYQKNIDSVMSLVVTNLCTFWMIYKYIDIPKWTFFILVLKGNKFDNVSVIIRIRLEGQSSLIISLIISKRHCINQRQLVKTILEVSCETILEVYYEIDSWQRNSVRCQIWLSKSNHIYFCQHRSKYCFF